MRLGGLVPEDGNWIAGLKDSLGFLTVAPVSAASRPSAESGWAWPITGALLGAIAGAAVLLLSFLGASPAAASLVAVVLLVAMTGAFHEDGLADAADGIFSGKDRDSVFKIMKDSRIGTFGALALITVFAARWLGVASLASDWSAFGGLAAACASSRAAMLAAMHFVPPAREDGLSASMGAPSGRTVAWAALIAAVIAILACGWAALPMLAVAALAAAAIGWHSRSKLGGQTGDVLGACQQCAEAAALLCLAAFA